MDCREALRKMHAAISAFNYACAHPAGVDLLAAVREMLQVHRETSQELEPNQ